MKMTEPEEFYVAKFRELAAKNRAIVGVIVDLKAICESLNDWQKTAADLASPDGVSARSQWQADKTTAIAGLRSLLIEYDQLTKAVEMAWRPLSIIQKDGLASPETLRTPKEDAPMPSMASEIIN
jgi:hypothetical protein